jgi:uncharacterized RDD family membrane protein YckC
MNTSVEYGGFWVRVGAALIDSVMVLLVLIPVLTAIYGTDYWLSGGALQGPVDFVVNYIFPALVIIAFWVYKSATPGKMATRLVIVDADTGQHPSTKQFVIRYLGYYLSVIPLMLGIFWVAFDKRKQGWHDKLAGTVVVRRR